ncbi:MAG: peptidoglycan-binding domain-containing protein [Pyrinomonadaceae bacterium]
MKKYITPLIGLLLALSFSFAAQDNKPSVKTASTEAPKTAATKHKGIFRATTDQIKQAQEMLKQKNYYTGESTGKLDPATRAGLKKLQEAEKIKVTGTLNRETLEKMNITLTDKQKEM